MSLKILRNASGKILRRLGEPIVNVEYGYLYNWYAAIGNITSSDDWVVPNTTNVASLITYLGGDLVGGGKLKETGFTHWNTPNTGATNEFSFDGRGAGYRYAPNGSFLGIKQLMYFWYNRPFNASSTFAMMLKNDDITFLSNSVLDNKTGASIRLLYTGVGTPTSYTGNDGKVYDVVIIGSQYWLSANLMETKYRDGTPIPEETDNTNWSTATTGLRCSYNNLESNAGTTLYGVGKILCREYVDYTAVKYGLLYNWYAATDARNIAPVGFHVPTIPELEALSISLGGDAIAGGHLKETGTAHWISPNTDANNSSGFNARGGGGRNFFGDNLFSYLNEDFHIWASTEADGYGDSKAAYYSDGTFYSGSYEKNTGFSLRFIADSGTPITAIGNDGKVYPCVTIGTQTWTAVNSMETKYRNGDLIPEVTDNAAWAALTTGGLCAYNNDWSNV